MESNGKPGRIHISQATADQLISCGRFDWVIPREEAITAKGKGKLQTFWLLPKSVSLSTANGTASTEECKEMDAAENGLISDGSCLDKNSTEQFERMVDWDTEVLEDALRKVVAARCRGNETDWQELEERAGEDICFDEVVEVFDMTGPSVREMITYRNEPLPEVVSKQLRLYVSKILSMYQPNAFHNCEHASHVVQSALKLLHRVEQEEKDIEVNLGIASDPMIAFAMLWAALVHDVDHPGIPNYLLVKEDPVMASKFGGKNVAERHSLDVAWKLLLKPEFEGLRHTIFTTEREMNWFRQLVVNAVVTTDIFDENVAALRSKRQEKAFSLDVSMSKTAMSRKATVAMALLIQASDVSHTMQHWHVYRKWNERFYREMLALFQSGRWDTDPTDGWYESEIKFFDNYVLPLAQTLKECDVFGVSSDEFLDYAEHNRSEWVHAGREIVEEMRTKYSVPPATTL